MIHEGNEIAAFAEGPDRRSAGQTIATLVDYMDALASLQEHQPPFGYRQDHDYRPRGVGLDGPSDHAR